MQLDNLPETLRETQYRGRVPHGRRSSSHSRVPAMSSTQPPRLMPIPVSKPALMVSMWKSAAALLVQLMWKLMLETVSVLELVQAWARSLMRTWSRYHNQVHDSKLAERHPPATSTDQIPDQPA